MLKKTLLLLLIFHLFGCGYEPLYLKKNNLDMPIKNWVLKGDKEINRIVISQLKSIKNNNTETGYVLKLISEKKLEIISKDKNGNP